MGVALVSQWRIHPMKMVATVAMSTTFTLIQHGYLCVMTATERRRMCCRHGIRFSELSLFCLSLIICDKYEYDRRVRLLVFVSTFELVESRLPI